jgi:hypothetical protein
MGNIQPTCFKFLDFMYEADPVSVRVEIHHKLRTYIYVYVDRLEFRKLWNTASCTVVKMFNLKWSNG